jgi:WG containing repeat
MKKVLVFLTICFFNSSYSFTQICTVNKAKDLVSDNGQKIVINGNNNGKIFQSKSISIQNVICNGNCYFLQGNSLYILKENINNELTKSKSGTKKEFLNVGEIKMKDVALKTLQSLPQKEQICIKEIVQNRIEEGNYEVYEPKPNPTKASILKINFEENELEKYNLRIIYPPSENITRVKELGKYFFYDSNGNCIKPAKYGDCETYDNAEDFKFGKAIVKVEQKKYGIVDLKGTFVINPIFEEIKPFGESAKYFIGQMIHIVINDNYQNPYAIYEFSGGTLTGTRISKEYAKINNFKDAFATAQCFEGGFSIIDTSSYVVKECLKYSSLSNVFASKYLIATNTNNKKNIIDITDRKYLTFIYDDIQVTDKNIKCTLKDKTFELDFPKDNTSLFRCISGDCELYKQILNGKN